jgi:hypothetical protein
MFHWGRIDKVDTQVPVECGCPAPVPVIQTDKSPAIVPDSEMPAQLPGKTTLDDGVLPATGAKPGNDAPQTLSSGPEIRPLPPSQPDDIHVLVDAPFVFRGKQRSAAPVPIDEAAALPVMESSARPARLETVAQPPPAPSAQENSEHHPVLRRIGRFFAAIFH